MNKQILILGILMLITYTIALLIDYVILVYALPVIYTLGVYA